MLVIIIMQNGLITEFIYRSGIVFILEIYKNGFVNAIFAIETSQY